jgi:hypothetical protein
MRIKNKERGLKAEEKMAGGVVGGGASKEQARTLSSTDPTRDNATRCTYILAYVATNAIVLFYLL